MKIIQSLGWYFPDSTGGTEIYVSGLAQALLAHGYESVIAAAQSGIEGSEYVFDDLSIFRYPAGSGERINEIRGHASCLGFDRFVAWLASQPRGIYHQHSWTTNCGLHHLRAAKALGFKTVLTVHVAANLCLRGTMLLDGRESCDGKVIESRCTRCWAQSRGAPDFVGRSLAWVPRSMSALAERLPVQNRWFTAIASRELVRQKQGQLAAMAAAADRVVAVCGWLRDGLRLNGVPEEKIVVVRQGVTDEFRRLPVASARRSSVFRLGYLGRWDEVKGLHVLFEALRQVPRELPVELSVYAVANVDNDRRYRDSLVARFGGDERIKIKQPVAHAELPRILSQFDMLAVPSQVLETGPLVVLEAQAMGIPVLGSRRGGIAELVTHGVDGYLVEPADCEAWAKAIMDAARGNLMSASAPNTLPPVRRMADVARDMAGLYREIEAGLSE